MKPIIPTPALLRVASRVIWFKEPDEALKAPFHFLAYAMRYGSEADFIALEEAGYGVEQLAEALNNAPPGVFDEPSWDLWNRKCGRTVVPPLPRRIIPITKPFLGEQRQ